MPLDKHKGGHVWTQEQFVNRPDIKFLKCHDCGEEQYPDGFYRVGEGKTVTIVWPT